MYLFPIWLLFIRLVNLLVTTSCLVETFLESHAVISLVPACGIFRSFCLLGFFKYRPKNLELSVVDALGGIFATILRILEVGFLDFISFMTSDKFNYAKYVGCSYP